MVLIKIGIASVLLQIVNCYVSQTTLEDTVIELGDSDFESGLSQHETALVMFYAPWCNHCKKLRPKFDMAAYELKNNEPPVALARIDCSEKGKETCRKYSISGYPVMKIFRNGLFSHDYNGKRDTDAIINYMKMFAGPVKEVLNNDDIEEMTKGKIPCVIGFFKSESKMKKKYLKAVDKLRNTITCAFTINDELLSQYGVENGFILFRPKYLRNKFEEDFVKYDGTENEDEMDGFIKKNMHGLVGYRNAYNYEEFEKPLVVAYYDVDYKRNVKGTNYWRNRILKVAKQFADQFTFAVSSKKSFSAELNDFDIGLIDKSGPFIVAKDANKKKFFMKKDFSVESFEEFMKDLADKKLEPYVKSLPVPKENDGPVKIAVANSFKDVVLENNKDTLIEFYAPWCGHCKELAPIYEELGKKMENEDVEIVQMDAANNDIPEGFTVDGYPTLYWLKKEEKDKPVVYDGARNLQDFIKYIAKHSTEELKSYTRAGVNKEKEL